MVASGTLLASDERDSDSSTAPQFSTFASSYRPTFSVLGVVVLVVALFGFADHGISVRATLVVLPVGLLLACRLRLQTLDDQQRASVLMGRTAVVACLFISTTLALTADGSVATVTFLSTRMLWILTSAWLYKCAGICSAHRVAVFFLTILGIVVSPSSSALGQPYETAVSVAAVLVGNVIGAVHQHKLPQVHGLGPDGSGAELAIPPVADGAAAACRAAFATQRFQARRKPCVLAA